MQFITATVAAGLLAVAAAAPAELELAERAAAPCTVKYTGIGQANCGAVGFSSAYSKYLIELDLSTAANSDYACLRECNRHAECNMYYLSPEKKCRIYTQSMEDTFTSNPSATGHYSSYLCGYLTGNCGVENSDFELYPMTNGFVFPWSEAGTVDDGTGDSTIKLLNTQTDTYYSDSPNGFKFIDFNIAGKNGRAALTTFTHLLAGKSYKVSYLYNFRSVSTTAGSVPAAYNIETIWCGNVVHTLAVSTTQNINTWRTASFTFKAVKSCQQNDQEFQWRMSAKNGPANPNGYIARIGFDGLSVKAATA